MLICGCLKNVSKICVILLIIFLQAGGTHFLRSINFCCRHLRTIGMEDCLFIGAAVHWRLLTFGSAFKLGRHEWFALRRLITNSRSSAFTGGFLKSFSFRRIKNWTIQILLYRKLRFRNSPTGEQIQNGRPTDEIIRDLITPWCDPPLSCPCFFLAETSVLKIS